MALKPTPESVQPEPVEKKFSQRVELVMASVDLYQTYLLNYLRSMTTHHNAEDILQELWKFVVVHFAEDKIDCLPLLRRKAYQLFVDDYRRNASRRNMMAEVEQQSTVVVAKYEYDEANEGRLYEKFWQEFPVDLSTEQKNVLWQHARYGLTFQEIENKFGIKASTACDWVMLGRQLLEKYLNEN